MIYKTVFVLLSNIYFFFLFSLPAFGFPGDLWVSPRAAGMGNAYTAVVTNPDSLFYNPAGLAINKRFGLEVANLGFGVNKIASLSEMQDIMDASGDISSIMNKLYGRRLWINGQGRSILYMPNFAFGAFGIANGGFQLRNPVLPHLDTNYRLDYGMIGGGGLDLIPGILQMGLSLKRIDRRGATVPISASTLASLDIEDLLSEIDRRGVAYSADFGLRLSAPSPMQPTLSFVWRDIGDTRFTVVGGDRPFASHKNEMIFGLSALLDLPLLSIQPALDFRKINDKELQFGQKLNVGVELGLPLIDLRGGFHQGYYTLGAGFNLFFMRIEAATYGLERGAYPGQAEERRYLINMAFDFGITAKSRRDAEGNNSSRRRIKQRR